jgi:hypothetical protein
MVEKTSTFSTSELQVGHILPTGVILQVWEDEDQEMGRVVIAMTAAGVGHAWPKGSMVTGVIERLSDELVEQLKAEFVDSFIESFGDPTQD